MAQFIANAFSLNMVSSDADLRIRSLTVEDAAIFAAQAQSCVGHADTAALFSQLLGVEVPMNRTTVQLSFGDQLLVGQYSGPRLAEGATTLPEGASVRWLLVAPQ